MITWYTAESKDVISDPPCINERYEITKRKCTENRRWIPSNPPSCQLVQRRFIPSCPFDFINKNNYCIYVSKPQAWKPRCPFSNDLILTENEHMKILFSLNISKVWLPVKRNQPFGKYVWFHPFKLSIKFKHSSLKKAVKDEENIHDCIIITKMFNNTSNITYEIKIVHCNENHHQVCIYNLKSSFFPSTKDVTCFNNNKNICYALTYASPYQGRDAFCKNFAKPSTELENYIVKTLVKDDTCWIGLKRNNVQKFQWENTRNYPEFTDWRLTADFRKHLVGISKYGWELFQAYSLNCGICEVNIDSIEINLTLRPNFKTGLLILTVYSPSYFINEDKITCSVVGINDVDLEFSSKIIPKRKYSTDNILNQLSKRDNRVIYVLRPNTKYFNYYTCEGIILPKTTIVKTEKVLFGTKRSGNEYALHLIIEHFCEYPSKCDPVINNERYKEVLDDINDDIFDHIRAMKILSVANKNLELIVHIHVKDKKMDLTEEYSYVRKKLSYIFNKTSKLKYISLKNCFGCLEQTTINGNNLLHWEYTNTGSTIMPKELCLDSSGLPITRTCKGDFIYGAEWTRESGRCSPNISVSPITKNLHGVYVDMLDYSADEVVSNLSSLTKKSTSLIPSDIYYISQILKYSNFTNYSNGTFIADSAVSIINNLIVTDTETLKLSNQLLNSTNVLLDAFEKLMEELEDINLGEDGILQIITPFLFYQVSDILFNNITGVIMFGPNNSHSFTDYSFKPLSSDTDMNTLLKTPDLEIATFIPDTVIQKVKAETNKTRVYIAIFYNNSLFVEDEEQNKEIASRIVSVSIQGYENYLSSPIPVIFKSKRKSKTDDLTCSYWNFGHNTYEETYPTRWANDGGIRWNVSTQDIEVCAFTHLTHFALLLGEPDDISLEILEYHDRNLSIITAIGCCLSVIGITVVLITAILFKSWRQKTGTKILLNLCASVGLEMCVIFIADTKYFPINNIACIIIGSILHYATLSSFCWMLVIAYLQYLRFVKVIGSFTTHLILKSCIIGWVLPFLPVISLLIWDCNSYSPMANTKTTGLCYPQGNTIYFTVLLPISAILIINIIVFCFVMYSVTQKTVKDKTNTKNLKLNQLKLAVLLFFLLGITWIFGFLTVFKDCVLCLYLFCATATMQGFVLFIFYVVLDSTTRKLWVALLRPHFNISRKKNLSRLSSSSHELHPCTTDSTIHTQN